MKTSLSFWVIFLFASLSNSCLYAYSGGDGGSENPFRISSADDLLTMSATPGDWGSHFILTNDVDLTTQTFTQALIAPDSDNTTLAFEGTAFSGNFDGRGFKIQNLKINTNNAGNDYLGLFGKLDAGAAVINLTIEACSITGGGDSFYLGGLAGFNAGSVRNCRVVGVISCNGDHTLCAGGLVGSNTANIEACSALVNLTIQDDSYGIGGLAGENYGAAAVIRKSFAAGNVTVWTYSYYIGGLVGDNTLGSIYNCYAAGKVYGQYYYLRQVGGLAGRSNAGTIQYSFSSGRVDAGYSTNVGGFLGYASGGSIANCFWDTVTSGQAGSAGGIGVVGKNSTDMKKLSTFTDAAWDFLGETIHGTDDIWRMCADNISYPKLTWEFVKTGDFQCPDGVASDDLERLAEDWLSTSTTGFYGADADGDKNVTLQDFTILADSWLID
jgi:hypothetical protein